MLQLRTNCSVEATGRARPLVDLEPLRKLAVTAGLLNMDDNPEELRLLCLSWGLSKSGWRFITRHGRAAWVAIEDFALEREEIFDKVLRYVQLQATARLPRPATHSLGQRLCVAEGNMPEFDSKRRPRLLSLAERHFSSLSCDLEQKAFASGEWVRVLNWFRDEQPDIDKNQWKAGWPAIRRAYARWRELHPEKLGWRSLLQPFQELGSSVRPLTSSYDLALEGHEMRHCVASYAGRCHRGGYRLFSVQRPQPNSSRVTVGIEMGSRGWVVEQVKGLCNAEPLAEDLRVAAVIANRYELAWRAARQRRQADERTQLKRHREAQLEALKIGTSLPDEVARYFTAPELECLERRAFWMEQLVDGGLQPISMAQVHFVAAARGMVEAQTQHESLWHRYRQALCGKLVQ